MPRILNTTWHDEKRIIRLENVPPNNLPTVLIRKEALEDIYHHAEGELYHEVGGYLIGFPAKDPTTGVNITYIEKAIRAIYESSPTHVTMHPVSFHEVENIRQRDGTILVGWYHSHHRMSIFMSGTDQKNYKDYHSEDYQIAIVVDPSKTPERYSQTNSDWIGFYGWNENGKEVRLPKENIVYVSGRPEEVAVGLPVISPEPQIAISAAQKSFSLAIANFVEKLSGLLWQVPHELKRDLPIVILPEQLKGKLVQALWSVVQNTTSSVKNWSVGIKNSQSGLVGAISGC